MRVIDEQIKLLHCNIQRGTQHLNQGGGWQGPSVVHQATRVYPSKVFSAHTDSGVIAKVSRLLRRLRGSGNGNFCIRGICVTTQEPAHSAMRRISGLDLRQCFPFSGDEPTAPIQPSLLEPSLRLNLD